MSKKSRNKKLRKLNHQKELEQISEKQVTYKKVFNLTYTRRPNQIIDDKVIEKQLKRLNYDLNHPDEGEEIQNDQVSEIETIESDEESCEGDDESPNDYVYDPNKPKDFEPPFEYHLYDWFKKDKLPDFMLMLLDHPYILLDQKHIIVNDFLPKYLNDLNYAKSVQGGFLVLVDKIYIGIRYSLQEIFEIGTYKNAKYSIPIFEYKINGSYDTVDIRQEGDIIYTSYRNHKPISCPYRKII
jgi:hypothetical protein